MSDAATGEHYIKVTIDPDPGFKLIFDTMTITEELGRPFLIELNLSSDKARGDLKSTLGSSVTIEMTELDNSKSYYNGILTRASFTGLSGGVYRYQVELRPWIWLLTRTQDCKIFQNMSVWDILQKVFKDHEFSAIADERKNQAGSIVLEYCVQYRESAFDFVTRLMEQYGLYYFFHHTDSEHTLVFADDQSSHTALTKAVPFYAGQTEQRPIDDHIWEWTSDLNLRPGGVTLREYMFTTPAADTETKSLHPGGHKHGTLEVYDYPGDYDTVANGQKLAEVRMQYQTARQQVFDGRSNSRKLRAGAKFTLSDATDTSLNQEYLVTRATASITGAEGSADSRGKPVDSYRVTLSAISGTVPFRLEQTTPDPVIQGLQTALVVGGSGDEITTDKYGRIKVQFYWDRVGTKNENSSCWVRVAQTLAGVSWGAMFIPRIGMEVVVGFLEGNPDRPLVTGVVYNGTQTVPYALPGEATKSTIKTNSSKGGGGFNELRFEDKKGSEEIFLQAQKDFNWKVLHDEVGKVTNDQTLTVEQGKRTITVSTGNDSKTVSKGNHSLEVTAGGSKITTGQAMEITANTSIKLTATSSIELTVGGTTIKLDASGITFNGTKISGTASAQMKLAGGGEMELTGGIIKIN